MSGTDRRGVIAGVVEEHRYRHDPRDGTAYCKCGWSGPYTRCDWSIDAHVAEQIDRALGQGEGEREGWHPPHGGDEDCGPCVADYNRGFADGKAASEGEREGTTVTEAVTLPDEMRDEAVALMRETVAMGVKRKRAGRTSMPIYVDDAMALVVLAARAIGVPEADLVPTEVADNA